MAEKVEEGPKTFLDLDGDLDEDPAFEDQIQVKRSLASIFESDEDEILEVDASLQDETLLVRNSATALHAILISVLVSIRINHSFSFFYHCLGLTRLSLS